MRNSKRSRKNTQGSVDISKVAQTALNNDNKLREDVAAKQKEDSISTKDAFVNYQHNLGIGADSPLTSSSYNFTPITRNPTLLQWIHRSSWIAGRAVDVFPEDMTKAGVEIVGEIKPKDIANIDRHIVQLQIWKSLCELLKWARLYGGAIGVLLIDGQNLSTPLRIDTISKGQFKGIAVFDRWLVEPDMTNLVTELGPELGLPKFYKINGAASAMVGLKIHHSRCIRQIGVELPYWQKIQENMWGLSVIERFYDRLLSYDSSTVGSSQLIFKSFLRILKVEGLREIVATGGKALEGLLAYVDNMRRYQSNEGMSMLDSNDSMDALQNTSLTGVADVLKHFAEQISGAVEIPMVRLFGQSPSGFSTGDTDLQNYYDTVNRKQESELKLPVFKIYRCIAASLGITLPDDIDITFRNLWQVSEVERGQIVTSLTGALFTAEENGIINRATVLKELKQSSRVTGVFSNITEEMISDADKDLPKLLPDVPGILSTQIPTSDNNIETIDVACIAIVTDTGKLLMTQRSESCRDYQGFWTFPGGIVEPFENALTAAVRELAEEANITLNEDEFQRLRCIGVKPIENANLWIYGISGIKESFLLSNMRINHESVSIGLFDPWLIGINWDKIIPTIKPLLNKMKTSENRYLEFCGV